MSNARDLALIEKWADIAKPPTPSPTSPLAIKFCCCPQRRRYNFKSDTGNNNHHHSNTLHARNIFVDNNFTYIDDVPRTKNGGNHLNHQQQQKQHRNSSSTNEDDEEEDDNIDNADNCDNDYDDIVEIDSCSRSRNNGGSNNYGGCRNINNHTNDDDDDANEGGNETMKLMNERNAKCEQQWRQDNKVTTTTSSSSSSNNNGNGNGNSLAMLRTATTTTTAAATPTIERKTCAVTNIKQSGNDNNLAASTTTSNIANKTTNNVSEKNNGERQQPQQQIQRLSDSIQLQQQHQHQQQKQQQQFSNKENKLSNHNNNNNKSDNNNRYSGEDKTKLRCNYCKLPEAEPKVEPQSNNNNNNHNNNSKIDSATLQNKMTITTKATNVAVMPQHQQQHNQQQQRSECGTTTTTTTAAATTPMLMMVGAATEVLGIDKPPQPPPSSPSPTTATKPNIAARPTTPSRLKTVIKTTMVKRSPSHDSTSISTTPPPPTTTATASTAPVMATHVSQSNSCGNGDEPRPRSVRERIAAYAAGNEQQDVKKLAKIQCNKNQINMTTNPTTPTTTPTEVKSAISVGNRDDEEEQPQQQQMLINGTAMLPLAAGNTSPGLSDVAATPMHDASSTVVGNASVFSTGCATMPRTRLGTASSDNKYGSITPVDNLDLAHSLDLIDDDAEDPYGALQEYLERVKLEINEVFEHRKAQRLQAAKEAAEAAEAAAAATTDEITADASLDGLSRSTESDSNAAATTTTTSKPVTTQLRALSPPPLSPTATTTATTTTTPMTSGGCCEETLKRRTPRSSTSDANSNGNGNAATASEDVNIWANKFLRDLDNLMTSDKFANNGGSIGGSASACNSPTCRTAPMLLSAAATAAIQSRYGKGGNSSGGGGSGQATLDGQNGIVLRPEKHATIPLQSFNLDCGRNEAAPATTTTTSGGRSNVAYMRTLSAPGQNQHHQHHIIAADRDVRCQRKSLATSSESQSSLSTSASHKLTNFQSLLKIEEMAAAAAAAAKAAAATATGEQRATTTAIVDEMTMKSRRHRQLDGIIIGGGGGGGGGNTETSSATSIMSPKRVGINHAGDAINATTTTTSMVVAPPKATAAAATTTSSPYYTDVTKKGSTSTIWTSEESIVRSVGAVDEDNNSTSSSSACEEAAVVLSSGKSGISLDSSGLDNDNNESGIGTATPPKDMSHWKNHPHNHHHHHHHHHHHSVRGANDNESVSSSMEALRSKVKFQKSGSVVSSDDPDVLEVLSLCDDEPTAGVEDKNTADELDDECHDEFDCDCTCTDGDASSASGGSGSRSSGNVPSLPVVLRRKPITLSHCVNAARGNASGGGGVIKSGRSHSLDPHHMLPRKLQTRHCPATVAANARERAQLSLALRQEPFQSLLLSSTTTQSALHHFVELPSPSSASLHSGHDVGLGIQEQLTIKSNSAPLLLKDRERNRRCDDFAAQQLTLRYSRSQSDRYLAEIEAVEACKWLRAAGFPQYAQMYEDHQFPIDLTNVAKDHTNLENDQLQSLYRRLCVLNRCATMRLDQSHKPQTPQKEESDDENFALSENWTFQPHIRRWSRIGEMGLELPPPGKLGNVEKTESSSKESSPDRFEDDAYDVSGAGITLVIPGVSKGGDDDDGSLNDSSADGGAAARLRRTGSERIKDGAKAFLRRVESIKSRRRKRQNRENVVISGPQVLDLAQLGQRSSLRKPDAVYSTPPSPSAVSPMHTFPKTPFFGNELKVPSHSENFLSPQRASPKRTPTTPRSMRTSPLHFFASPMPHLKEGKSDDSSSYYSDSQESSAGGKMSFSLRKPSKARRFLQRSGGKVDDIGAHSDSECHQGRKLLIKDNAATAAAEGNNSELKLKKLTRGGSLNLGKEPKKRDGFRSASFRSRSSTRKDNKSDGGGLGGEQADGGSASKRNNNVVRWHSFQMEQRPHMIFRKCFSQKFDPQQSAVAEEQQQHHHQLKDSGISFASMSAGQLQIIRKLALVTLTGYMERYCPTHRSGWNWELPKFIKKIKMPDYKDKKVFGVPLLLVLQRSGQTLPVAVRAALRWLQLNALDQVGLFRKSGGKSRITRLREIIEMTETKAECMDVFDTQQAYDVADMLKQYFRELPESLLTTKMSETFVAIFQHLPGDVRLDAIQCAVLLLPDENREILFVLLEFLTIVAANSQLNQMTSNNLGVCLAQSIFHSSIATGSASVSASPRRKGKGTGMPDMKELAEAKASHECLSFMIDHYKAIYTASKEKLCKCNFGYMEESKPVPLEALGEGMQFHNWRGYLYECTSATIKEGREKTRGWFTITSQTDSNVDIAYKKVGDGHPLRLWRCSTEIEGPPREVLDYIIKQRASWDTNLLQCQTVKKLDDRTEIYQYALDGQLTTDFCVLRSWQTDLPRGACVIVETSIDHAKAKPLYGAVRGVVLASRYLIEPCGSGRSRVMHLSRVDVKGKTPEWYNKNYGHICSHYLSRIRTAFKHHADGPESKV